MKSLNKLVSFLLELAMLGALAFWGFQMDGPLFIQWLAGLGLPVIVGVFWSIFMAPRAPRRISWPWLPVISLVLFLLAAVALNEAGERNMAIIFAATAVVNGLLVFIWRQY